MEAFGIVLIAIGLIILMIAFDKDKYDYLLFGFILCILGAVTINNHYDDPPKEKTIETSAVQIDTIYTINKNVVDTTYIIMYLKK